MNKKELIGLLNSKEVKTILDNLDIKHLYLVWSYSRWEHSSESDIDLIYESRKKVRVWGIKFIRNKTLLEEKLNKKVDLVNNEYIYKELKPFIEKDKILIY